MSDNPVEDKPPVTSLDWEQPKSHKRAGQGNRHTAPHARGSHCRVPGCTRRVASGYGVTCPVHNQADRRHGHPLQTTIEVRELEPYVRTIRRIIKRNQDRVRFGVVYERWNLAVQTCWEIEEQARRDKVRVRWRHQAAALIIEIAENVKPERIFELVAAMYLLQHMRPERFKSDTAFNAEILHVVRREAKAGRKFTNGKNRSTISYRTLSNKARDLTARFITTPLGAPALHLVDAEERRMRAAEKKTQEYRETMANLA